jgi:hypothetical protein
MIDCGGAARGTGKEKGKEEGEGKRGKRTSWRGLMLLGAVLNREAEGFGMRDVILLLS